MDKRQTNYQELLKQIDEQILEDRFIYLSLRAKAFIESAGYQGRAYCDEKILQHVIVDYFEDILRLKDFHGIEYVKTDKIAAYTIAWWIRRKPIQFNTGDGQEKDVFVNERFALSLMINECFFEDEIPSLENDDMKVFQNYLDYLLYYFKYRYCDPQVVELLIESFKMGSFVWKHKIEF